MSGTGGARMAPHANDGDEPAPMARRQRSIWPQAHPRADAHDTRPGFIHLAVLLCYGLLTVVLTWPLVLNVDKAIPGDGFDGWQNFWNLWWVRIALVDRVQNPYFTDLLYFPTGVELYFHTLNPFNGLLTLPVQLAGGLFVAYNTVVFFSWVLGGYGVFLLALWVWRAEARPVAPGLRYGVALIAGAVYTFAPLHMAHLLGHMQVMSLEWIPFYCLYLLRALHNRNEDRLWLRDSLLAGGFLILTGLCDWYFVLYLFFFTALALLWQLLVDFRGGLSRMQLALWWRSLRVVLVCGALFFILLGPVLVPMVQRALTYSFMVRPDEDLFVLSASLADFFVPNRLHTLFRPESFGWIGNQVAPVSERTISIGYVALGLALVAALRKFGRGGLWVVAALLFGMLALGPVWRLGDITWQQLALRSSLDSYWTPFALFNRFIPFMRISRSVSRYALMVQLSVAVLAAGGLYALIGTGAVRAIGGRMWRVGSKGVLVGGLLVLIMGEYWVAPYPISPPDTPAYYATLAEEQGGAILNLPMNYDRPGYLLYQTVHQRPLSVAYISRDDPRTLVERIPVLQHFRHLGPDIIVVDMEQVGQTVLVDLGVTSVVLDRYKMPDGLERTYTTEQAQRLFRGHVPEYENDRLTVYAVIEPAQLAAYPLLGAHHWGPLQEDDGKIGRRVGLEPANVTVRRAPADAYLRIRYRTQAGVTGEVRDGETEERLVLLDSSTVGQDVFVALAGVTAQITDGIPTQVVSLVASAEGGLVVNGVELVDRLPNH